ncbi:MAG: glycine reductase [Proteobacteria bacterium]|nr:glycine reductase [Pseudomonadota bacterium]
MTDTMNFAPEHDAPLEYMRRTREYYLALGYDNPYRWAHYTDAPFQPLKKKLADSTVTLITTAAPYQPDKGDQGPGAAYNAAAKFYTVYSGDTAVDHDMRISHIGYDRKHTTATDSNSWFPLPLMRKFAAEGRFKLARRFHGAPTNRSQRVTLETDAPEILARCRQDQVDAAVLVPNCPVCHQTVSLVARHLERNGIPTIVMGCARDIVEWCGVPRLLYSDFPLGNACGKPHEPDTQAFTLDLALKVLESAVGPRTTVQSPLRWNDDGDWKLDYNNLARMPPEEVARRRAEFDKIKQVALDQRKRAGVA